MNVPFLSWFNGKLTINNENKPIYIDRIVKPMLVRKSTIRCELVEKIYQISKINDYQIHLTCKLPIYIKKGGTRLWGVPSLSLSMTYMSKKQIYWVCRYSPTITFFFQYDQSVLTLANSNFAYIPFKNIILL